MSETFTAPSIKHKGRSKKLVALRNQRMIIRFYYWREIQRRRSDDIYEILANEEFFLHEITIRRIIREHFEYFHQLKKERPPEKKLQSYSFN